MPPQVLNKDSCRGCGSNIHKTACCPNRPCPCCFNYHGRGILDCPITKAVLERQHKAAAAAAKRADEAAKRAVAKEAKRAAKETQRAVKVAVFESLEPFGVEVRNKTCFRASNWDTEVYSLCQKCGKPEPKNGCWCMPHKH